MTQTELNLTSAHDQAIVALGATWPDAFIHWYDSLASYCGPVCATLAIALIIIAIIYITVKSIANSGLSLSYGDKLRVGKKSNTEIPKNNKSKKNRQRQKDRIS
ncbi:MAG: hypothetical protein ORN98_04560 [Alphaproteobacteria bacterium]|nr:hypothetical protein [Alphaproteobacteria bacterium]